MILRIISTLKRVMILMKTMGIIAVLKKIRQRLKKAQHMELLEPSKKDEIYLAKLASDIVVSVIIPTKNAGQEFEDLMSILVNQSGIKNQEIIIVDSGSIDDTVNIAKKYKAKVKQIKPEEFSHSYSRNMGAEMAHGDYLLFMTQDALPSSDSWIFKILVAILKNDVIAASCAETPRADADLFYKVISWNHYKFLGVDQGDRLLSRPKESTYEALRQNGQLSDIACMIKKDIFLSYKFRNDYAEDLDLGLRLIADEHKLAFLSSVRVIHSHNREAYYFLKRAFVDTHHLARIFGDQLPKPKLEQELLFKDILLSGKIIIDVMQNIPESTSASSMIKTIIGILENEVIKDISFAEHVNIQTDQYLDKNFKLFLVKVNSMITLQFSGAYQGIIIYALLDFLSKSLEYMNTVDAASNPPQIDDIKNSILKMFALICGSNLAYVDLFGKKDATMERIHYELIQGI